MQYHPLLFSHIDRNLRHFVMFGTALNYDPMLWKFPLADTCRNQTPFMFKGE